MYLNSVRNEWSLTTKLVLLLIIKSLLNGDEVRELLHEKELLAFLEASSNEAWLIPKEIKVSREELISIFKNLNNLLRSEGLRAEKI